MDFACRDDHVEKQGGVHVIQTFLSEDISEEVQIKGRTARQGKRGSYILILNSLDLQRQFGITGPQIDAQKKGSKLYSFLHGTRVKKFEADSADRKDTVKQALAAHTASWKYCTNLVAFLGGNSSLKNTVLEFLETQNK